MSGAGVAAVGVAVAMYLYSRRTGGACATNADEGVSPVERFRQQTHAPTTWLEAVYYTAEAIRHVYGETLGTWRTADLLIGLAYLARRAPAGGSTLQDIADAGTPYGLGLDGLPRQQAQDELARLQHCMSFGLALRQLRPAAQMEVLRSFGFAEEDFLMVQQRSWLLKPSYFLLRDRAINSLVLLIRGTQTIKDVFTSMTSASKPHHVVDAEGVTLGYTHFGMLAAARYIHSQVLGELRRHMGENPGMRLQLVGHSMGGGCAAILTMMLRELPDFANATCIAIACPAVMTLGLARSCQHYVTSVINDTDMVPTMSPAGIDGLRAEVMESTWAADFRRDARSYVVVRAVEASLSTLGGGISTVATSTAAATAWTTSRLTQGFRSCSGRSSASGGVVSIKPRKSTGETTDPEPWAPSQQGAALHATPHSQSEGARGSSAGSPADVASNGFMYGAIRACTGRRRKPHAADDVWHTDEGTGARQPPPAVPEVVRAADWVDDGKKARDARAWRAVLDAFLAWGWSSQPAPLPNRPGLLSSVATAPGAAATYVSQWLPTRFSGTAAQMQASVQTVGQADSQEEKQPLQEALSLHDQFSTSQPQHPPLRHMPPMEHTPFARSSQSSMPPGWLSADAFDGRSVDMGGNLWQSDSNQPPELMHMDSSSESEFEGRLPSLADLEQSMSRMEAEVAREEAAEQLSGSRLTSLGGSLTLDSPPGSPVHSHALESGEQPAGCDGLPDMRRLSDSRRTYPAGRILHLVPARLVFQSQQQYQTARQAGDPLLSSHSSSTGMPLSDTVPATLPLLPTAPTAAHAEAARSAADQLQASSGAIGALALEQTSARESEDGSCHGMCDVPTMEQARAAFDAGTQIALEAAWAATATPGQLHDPYVLLDHVPHECYARMRLCRTMVSSHFTPAYLRSMTSASNAFRSGYSA